MKENHNHYFKPCPYDTLDVYRVISIFGVSDPCIQHALKKLLCSGVRGYKDQSKDIQDVIDTLERWKGMREEDDKIASSELISPKVSLESTDIDSPVERWYPDNSFARTGETGLLHDPAKAKNWYWDGEEDWDHTGWSIVAYKVVKQ